MPGGPIRFQKPADTLISRTERAPTSRQPLDTFDRMSYKDASAKQADDYRDRFNHGLLSLLGTRVH
jgi:hypothetical protein